MSILMKRVIKVVLAVIIIYFILAYYKLFTFGAGFLSDEMSFSAALSFEKLYLFGDRVIISCDGGNYYLGQLTDSQISILEFIAGNNISNLSIVFGIVGVILLAVVILFPINAKKKKGRKTKKRRK